MLVFCGAGVGLMIGGIIGASSPIAVLTGHGTPARVIAVETKEVNGPHAHTECFGTVDPTSDINPLEFSLSGGCSRGVYYRWPSSDMTVWKRSAGTVGDAVFFTLLAALGTWLAVGLPLNIRKNRAVARSRTRR